jgi:glycosyltransferase involved in cell wall biosynthesis
MQEKIRVLMIGLEVSCEATGESYAAFRHAEALSTRVRLTVVAMQRSTHTPLAEQLPLAEVITFPRPKWIDRLGPIDFMLKPTWPIFYWHVRRLLARNRLRFDVAHQIVPLGMRYATPLRGSGIPYVIGPLGGALEAPPGFASEMASAPWFTKLRRLDRLRFRYDPWLRGSYADAALVLGVAPYVRDLLADVPVRRYEDMLELGIEDVAAPRPLRQGGALRLLHVGRGVRTKGLRDVVRALALLKDRPEITLVSAGDGEEIAICRNEAVQLGVADRVTFMRHLPRRRIEDLYAEADVFVFPSFREPTGNVLYEAMRWGLPVIAARCGGPDWIVDDTCGLKVDAVNPDQLARDVAGAIRRLADEPGLMERLSEGAREKVVREGLWSAKADRLAALYADVAHSAARGDATRPETAAVVP